MANNNERRTWLTTQVVADPFKEKHLYVVQELQGAWVDGPSGPYFKFASDTEEPVLSRVVYMKMQEDGKMVNVNSGSWEGRKPDGRSTENTR